MGPSSQCFSVAVGKLFVMTFGSTICSLLPNPSMLSMLLCGRTSLVWRHGDPPCLTDRFGLRGGVSDDPLLSLGDAFLD